MISPPLILTPVICPSSIINPVACVLKRTSPPNEMIFSRIFLTILRNKSVPTCGWAIYKISSGAPASTKASNTLRPRKSLTRVVNFPSENVPAPPSPN